MATTDLFKYAAQKRLRFAGYGKGELMAEDLYDLPLTALDVIAKTVNKELKSSGEESFIPNARTSPKQADNQVRLDIVKNVIQHKVDTQEKAAKRSERNAQLARIKELYAAKADENLKSKSFEDLEKMMAELSSSED